MYSARLRCKEKSCHVFVLEGFNHQGLLALLITFSVIEEERPVIVQKGICACLMSLTQAQATSQQSLETIFKVFPNQNAGWWGMKKGKQRFPVNAEIAAS